MAIFGEIFQDLIIKTLKEIYQFFTQYTPKIAIVVMISLIGWLCAVLIKKIISKLVKAFGLDVLSEKTGVMRFLEKGGIKRSLSSIIGLGFYWLIIFSTLVMVFDTLNLEAASQLIKQAIFYIPNIIIALILLALGIFLGQFVGKLVQASSNLANMPFPDIFGKAANYAIIGLAIMGALEHLGVASTIVIHSFIVIFGVLPLIFSLIFLVGGRDIMTSILAGRLLNKVYKKGERIEFDSVSGEIASIDFITTRIKTDAGETIIPNSALAKNIISKTK